MKEHEKLEAMYRHMDALAVPRATAFPPAWRLMWRIGWHVPPPLFLGFWPLALTTGAAFGLLWGLAMLLMSAYTPVVFSTWAACLTGLLFGLLFSGLVRMKAGRYKLPPWSEYQGQGQA